MKIQKAVTVTFPAPLPAEITCPICEGNKCKVCEMNGKIKVTVDAKIPIQRSHIVKYIVDNIRPIATEITRQYGLTPQIETLEEIDIDGRNYEIVQISSKEYSIRNLSTFWVFETDQKIVGNNYRNIDRNLVTLWEFKTNQKLVNKSTKTE